MSPSNKDDDNVSGRAKGGVARMKALTDDERKEMGKQAAMARWGVKATHHGSFKEHFGADVDCYVLDDDKKTAVISQRGMAEAIGFSRRGERLKVFVNSKTMEDYLGRDLLDKIENPVVFQTPGAAASGSVSSRAYGYDAAILIDLCKAILAAKADGKLGSGRYDNAVRQAEIIMGASAKSGIRNLVYALAGYEPTREEVIRAFKFYIQEEAREYEKEFPEQLYREWYRLYDLPRPERSKPWKFAHLTLQQVYHPLARSNGRILDLVRVQKAQSADRHAKLHQFLSVIGVKALRTHLGQLLGIAQISADRDEYERHVKKVFGDQLELDLRDS